MGKVKKGEDNVTFTTKKCYECFTHLPLDATECYACKKKVGKVDRNGIAGKPTDVKSYVVFALAFAALVVFLWKAFLK
jgi:hypothetical protein